mmetsp:Transcript_26516/g.37376  ORF Transcript_26516/g.37376 Transcript_26516/m.37376 type:complete len:170 (-) Transcript_26516:298-807(-)
MRGSTAPPRPLLVTLLLALFASQCVGFGIVGRSRSTAAATSPLFKMRSNKVQELKRLSLSTTTTMTHTAATTSMLFMAAENGAKDENDDEKTPTPAEEREKAEGFGPLTAALIAVPLFCKFIIVLVIKFLTDLVVYPLLLLYRLARMTKNKLLKLGGKDDDDQKSALES